MKFFHLFIFIFIAQPLFGQTTLVECWRAVEFVKSINVKGPTIKADKYNNIYMLTNQTDANPLVGYSLVKYDSSGNMLWNKNYPPGGIGIIYGSFTVDSIGNAYVGLHFDGGLPFYDADAILIKYGPEGDKLWEANYGLNQSGDSYIYYSDLDTLGRLIAFGVNWHETDPAGNFMFISAIDTANGKEIWKTKVEGDFYPQNMRLHPDRIQLLSTYFGSQNGGFAITQVDYDGHFLDEYKKKYTGYLIDFNYISKSGNVIFGNRGFGYNVTKVSPAGDTLWRYEHPVSVGILENWTRDVIEDDSFNVYATGAVKFPGLYTELVTTKFSPEGTLLWQKVFHSWPDSLIDTGDKLYNNHEFLIVSGTTQWQNKDAVGLIHVYNPLNGEINYEITISSNNVFGVDHAFIKGNKIFFVSTGFLQPSIGQTIVVTGCYKLPKISAVSTHTDIDIQAFPNPAIDFIHLDNLDPGVFQTLHLYDQKGVLVREMSIESPEMSLPLDGLPTGNYTLLLGGPALRLSKTIIVLR